jgi:hypothetical protein
VLSPSPQPSARRLISVIRSARSSWLWRRMTKGHQGASRRQAGALAARRTRTPALRGCRRPRRRSAGSPRRARTRRP